MRQIASVALVLLILAFVSLRLNAQSGRNRAAQSTNAEGSPRGQPAWGAGANSADQITTEPASGNLSNEPTTNGPANTQGETIDGDVIHVNTSLVMVPVTVMDRYGKYIPNLRQQDFHISDEGVEQRIAYFATVDQPFTVALVIDTSGSTHFRLEEIQDAAIAFVNQLEPDDRVMVISFDDQIRILSEPTNDRDALTRAIRRTRTGGGTRLYDAVDMVIRQELSRISGRKAVVLFTDGVDTTSRHATYSITLGEARESDGAIYTVAYDTSRDLPQNSGQRQIPWPGGRGGISMRIPFPGSGGGRGGPGGASRGPGGSSPGDYRRANDYLHELAQESGGRYYRGDTLQEVSQAFVQVADELRRQYSLGYYPTPVGQPGQRRQIRVRVNQSDLVVKARDSYIYSEKNNDKESGRQQPAGTTPQSKRPSGSP